MSRFDFLSPIHPELGAAVSREESLEALRETLREDARCWLWLTAALGAWFAFFLSQGGAGLGVLALSSAILSWLWLGRLLSEPRVQARFAHRLKRRALLAEFQPW
ncbi:hypothetical protein [Aquimonas voraii]|uniref:Uncharacterized protein n=1 Tax=Aquimonas voraii TaxID=265719 RepID=A0A1G6RZY8_9GAMM|nr:hypothetical protein [Aquimonas voraii]SDD09525.1 hypothetical protein SAMN04488509_101176 [Aquimonas voraii]